MELFAQQASLYGADETTSVWFGGAMLVWYLIIWLIAIIALWKVFEKAGYAGWKSIIPLYNTFILVKIAGRPGWWFLLLFVPLVNFVVYIVLSLDIAKAFGKSAAFGIFGLFFFSFIGYMILGWGDATYQLAKPAATSSEDEE